MLRRYFCISGLALTAMPALSAVRTPEQILKDLYALYVSSDDAGMDRLNAFKITDLMTPDLAVLHSVVSENPDGDLPPLDWDPFVNGQDFGVTGLKITGVSASKGRTVTARFNNLGSKTTVIYDFVELPAGWRFDDVRYPEDTNGFGPFSLRRFALDYLDEAPADGAPRFMILKFYDRLIRPPANLPLDDLTPFTPALQALYDQATKARGSDLPLVDWNVFTNSQEARLSDVRVKALDKTDYQTGQIIGQSISAHFWNSDRLTVVTYDFVRHGTDWRINDVRYPVNETYPDGFSLTHFIETDGKEAAVPSAY